MNTLIPNLWYVAVTGTSPSPFNYQDDEHFHLATRFLKLLPFEDQDVILEDHVPEEL